MTLRRRIARSWRRFWWRYHVEQAAWHGLAQLLHLRLADRQRDADPTDEAGA